MKRWIALLLAVLLCLSLLGCQAEIEDKIEKVTKKDPEKTEESRESVSTPLLYKVSDDAGNVIWLLGSIHVGMEDYYPLPDYVLDAFDGSEIVIRFEKLSGTDRRITAEGGPCADACV